MYMFQMYMDHTSFVNHLKLNERIIDNLCFFYNQSDGWSYKCLVFFFTEKAKWRNIRKNHKRTSGIEHILKYYNITKGFMWYSYWIRFKGKNHFVTCNSCTQCTKLIFNIYEKSCESLMPSISLPNGQNSLSEIFNIQGSFTEYYN